jgi:hypothetical protein
VTLLFDTEAILEGKMQLCAMLYRVRALCELSRAVLLLHTISLSFCDSTDAAVALLYDVVSRCSVSLLHGAE